MPTIHNYYVIAPDRLSEPLSFEAIGQVGALWAQIEGEPAYAEIDRAFGRPIIGYRGFGTYSPAETAALLKELVSASPELLAKIEADSRIDRTYWALRDTADEAVRRGACMSIRFSGDGDDQLVWERERQEDERREADEAAAVARENPPGPHDALAQALLRKLIDSGLLELTDSESREEVVDDLAGVLAMHGTSATVASELTLALLDHKGVSEVFGGDEDIATALRAVVKEQ